MSALDSVTLETPVRIRAAHLFPGPQETRDFLLRFLEARYCRKGLVFHSLSWNQYVEEITAGEDSYETRPLLLDYTLPLYEALRLGEPTGVLSTVLLESLGMEASEENLGLMLDHVLDLERSAPESLLPPHLIAALKRVHEDLHQDG